MKFWKAIKALEEGKKVRCIDWENKEYYIQYLPLEKTFYTPDKGKADGMPYSLINGFNNVWEIVEEPELYWQFRYTESGYLINNGSLNTQEKINELIKLYGEDIEKHAGPWVKIEDGFKKQITGGNFEERNT